MRTRQTLHDLIARLDVSTIVGVDLSRQPEALRWPPGTRRAVALTTYSPRLGVVVVVDSWTAVGSLLGHRVDISMLSATTTTTTTTRRLIVIVVALITARSSTAHVDDIMTTQLSSLMSNSTTRLATFNLPVDCTNRPMVEVNCSGGETSSTSIELCVLLQLQHQQPTTSPHSTSSDKRRVLTRARVLK